MKKGSAAGNPDKKGSAAPKGNRSDSGNIKMSNEMRSDTHGKTTSGNPFPKGLS